MITTRDIGDQTTDPGGKEAGEWTTDARQTIKALWQLNGGMLSNVAGTNVITGDPFVPTGFDSYSDGLEISWVPVNSNTGPCTYNVGGVGSKPLVDPDGSALAANALIAGRLTSARFFEADDHFRLTVAGGTTNVTVEGGIILQRRPPSRLVADTPPTTQAETVASQAVQATYSDSRIIIEGQVSAMVGAGVADADGLTLELMVDGNVEETVTDYLNPSQKQSVNFAFEHFPADTLSHTYEIQATATVSSEFIASSTFIVCSEMSPNP